jgi:hypothetical protein
VRAVVNVSFGQPRYMSNHARLQSTLVTFGETLLSWCNTLPPQSPSHADTPFAFKAYALKQAAEQGFEVLLWADSSIVPLRPLNLLWKLIETQGYWFSENLPHGEESGTFSNGQWTSDAALVPLHLTREESFTFPHVIATAFGLDLRHDIAWRFFAEYIRLAEQGTAFRGAGSNHDLSLSQDARVLGHRHDQTAASVLAWKLAMKLTTPPMWIVDGIPPTDDTILEIRRPAQQ